MWYWITFSPKMFLTTRSCFIWVNVYGARIYIFCTFYGQNMSVLLPKRQNTVKSVAVIMRIFYSVDINLCSTSISHFKAFVCSFQLNYQSIINYLEVLILLLIQHLKQILKLAQNVVTKKPTNKTTRAYIINFDLFIINFRSLKFF